MATCSRGPVMLTWNAHLRIQPNSWHVDYYVARCRVFRRNPRRFCQLLHQAPLYSADWMFLGSSGGGRSHAALFLVRIIGTRGGERFFQGFRKQQAWNCWTCIGLVCCARSFYDSDSYDEVPIHRDLSSVKGKVNQTCCSLTLGRCKFWCWVNFTFWSISLPPQKGIGPKL